MEISPEILDKHLADAAIEQLSNDYVRQGFHVSRSVPLGDATADLVARKGESLLIFEVKAGAWTPEKREEVRRLRDRAVHEGGRFILVMLPQPREKSVEIEGIEDILVQVVEQQRRESLAELATHVRVSEVTDVDLQSLTAGSQGIEVIGSALVGIELQFGSDSDADKDLGFQSSESVPLSFHLVLSHDFIPQEVIRLDLDLRELRS